MAQLFATHLAQKTPSTFISGQYDPEQELWVGDNQLQGASPNMTRTDTNTATERSTYSTTGAGAGDCDLDTTLDPDIDSDPDV